MKSAVSRSTRLCLRYRAGKFDGQISPPASDLLVAFTHVSLVALLTVLPQGCARMRGENRGACGNRPLARYGHAPRLPVALRTPRPINPVWRVADLPGFSDWCAAENLAQPMLGELQGHSPPITLGESPDNSKGPTGVA